MTQLSAHAYRRFLRQIWSEFLEILHRIFPYNVLTPVEISIYYMSKGLTFVILLIILLNFTDVYGHDLEMSCTKFNEKRLKINGEIDEKHALEMIVSLTLGH